MGMGDLYDQLNDLYKLHIAANNLTHGIKKEGWKLFEPSNFVYSFFAFNSFYSINWEESSRQNQLVKWEYNRNEDNPNAPNKTESQKIREMQRFIYSTYVNDGLSNEEGIKAKKEFALRLAQKLNKYLGEDNQSTIESLSGIVLDPNINQDMKDSFIRDLSRLLHKELTGKQFNRALDSVLYFVFNVRNNIFHGTKSVLEMMNRDQQIRLKAYTSILLAINEMLFEAVKIRFKWSRDQIYQDMNYGHNRRVRRIERQRQLNLRTIASKYGITIPDGPLFYPCSGYDTYDPIILFMDSISEFHFVDNRLIPKLPKLECKVSGYNENDIRRCWRNSADNLIIPEEIIERALAFDPYDRVDYEEALGILKQRNIEPAGYKENQVGRIYKQEWLRVKDDKKINIFRHVQDGLVTFASIDKIAVFFLRRDSEGEGGSGQKWFQKSVFEFILDKLLDGGLIVTDGSGWDPDLYDNAPWKSFWENRNTHAQNNVPNPDDFVYYNRQFKCLGHCGRGYGPVYVWQVTML